MQFDFLGHRGLLHNSDKLRRSCAFLLSFERWKKFKSAVAAAVAANGGTVSHQHGVGRDHATHLKKEKDAMGMNAIAELCRLFDPKKIMNPGKLLQDGGPWAE